ncbi:MAG: CDP-alcohol phosphatidyltransferase family protein [Candidatus Zixiibacteriota bacterium]|nr:MAG: CDP-alcohol phosphatidyltransferase family protein [candidate division Zixibacteria bacterium]
MQGKFLTASNFLSLLRVLLLVPIFLALGKNTAAGNAWALLFMGLAVVTDYMDGYLARKMGQISDLGRVLDPVADKICIAAVALFLASPWRQLPLPLWFVLVVVIRDLAVVGSGYLIYRRAGFVVTSNWWGKFTSGFLAALLITYVLHFDRYLGKAAATLQDLLLGLSLLFLLISTVSYGLRMAAIYAGRHPSVSSPSHPVRKHGFPNS